MTEGQPKRKWHQRLRNRYRMVVMNDDTFEERLSWRLTPLGILIFLGAITIVMTTIVVSLVAFTPIREYIPGYQDVSMTDSLAHLIIKSGSLEKSVEARQKYIDNIRMIITGEDTAEHPKNFRDSTKQFKVHPTPPSHEDSVLRNDIESQDQYSLAVDVKHKGGISNFFFFVPVGGPVSNTFNAAEGHYGVDISASDNDPVRATLDGTVISAGWTTEDGYVITIQHSGDLISIYKHNASLLKKAGDYVKAGDPIAIVGNSGEHATGPHLHFELWYNGVAVNPEDYIEFQ